MTRYHAKFHIGGVHSLAFFLQVIYEHVEVAPNYVLPVGMRSSMPLEQAHIFNHAATRSVATPCSNMSPNSPRAAALVATVSCQLSLHS